MGPPGDVGNRHTGVIASDAAHSAFRAIPAAYKILGSENAFAFLAFRCYTNCILSCHDVNG